MDKVKILFVCGRNQWRSPTGEAIYRNDQRVSVRSVGVSDKGRRRLSANDLEWAELVLVMEEKYKRRIVMTYRDRLDLPAIECLDIPDEYKYMDPELVELIRSGTEHYIDLKFHDGME